jgi:hypothetical protein
MNGFFLTTCVSVVNIDSAFDIRISDFVSVAMRSALSENQELTCG